jgi:hypothetical protein
VRSRCQGCWSMEGRSVDEALQFCDFNSAATRFYKQQLIRTATLPEDDAQPRLKLLLYSLRKWA